MIDIILIFFISVIVCGIFYMIYEILKERKYPYDPKSCDYCKLITFYSKCPRCGKTTKL